MVALCCSAVCALFFGVITAPAVEPVCWDGLGAWSSQGPNPDRRRWIEGELARLENKNRIKAKDSRDLTDKIDEEMSKKPPNERRLADLRRQKEEIQKEIKKLGEDAKALRDELEGKSQVPEQIRKMLGSWEFGRVLKEKDTNGKPKLQKLNDLTLKQEMKNGKYTISGGHDNESFYLFSEGTLNFYNKKNEVTCGFSRRDRPNDTEEFWQGKFVPPSGWTLSKGTTVLDHYIKRAKPGQRQ